MLKYRLISGSILLTCAMIAFFAQGMPSLIVFSLIGTFMLFNAIKEFFTFSKGLQIAGYPLFTGFFALLYLFAASLEVQPAFSSTNNALTTIAIIVFLIAGFIRVFNDTSLATGLKNLFVSTFCIFYIVWPLSFILKLFMTSDSSTNGKMLLLFMILVTKSSDIGAYFVGSICSKRPGGNHKIFPRLSPKKSWEGFVGGLLVSSAIAIFITVFFGSSLTFAGTKALTIFSAIILAIIFTTVGFIGDIAESSFKRACKLSDSSNILPGLGGAMDVLDSLIPTAPIFYAFLQLVNL